MEFRLNKIDTDLRERINAETKEGKIHRKSDIIIKKESYREGKNRQREKSEKKKEEKFSLSKYASNDKKISINAVKVENMNVEATWDKGKTSEELEYKGVFLDTRK